MKTELEVLIEARKLIERPENWTQGTYRAFKRGREVFCAVGAIYVAGDDGNVSSRVIDAVALAAGNKYSLTNFNDSHTHAEVLAAFDRAIEAEKTNAPA